MPENEYPDGHYTRNGLPSSPLYIYCADALKLDRRGLCRQCVLLLRDREDGIFCGYAESAGDDGERVCPYLEFDPASHGRMTRRIRKRR